VCFSSGYLFITEEEIKFIYLFSICNTNKHNKIIILIMFKEH